MKKFISGFVVGALLFGMVGAFAISYVANPVDFKVMVNGKEFVSDPPALEVEGRTYLPLRAMGEVLGVPVNWNEELRQAEVGTAPKNAKINSITQTNDKWKMTYLNYKQIPKIDEYTKAEDGKEFLLVFFDIENISSENQNFSMFYTDFYIDDIKAPQTIYGVAIDSALQLAATQVEPGKKAKGYFLFQVSPEWEKFEVIYNEDLLKADNKNVMRFTLTK